MEKENFSNESGEQDLPREEGVTEQSQSEIEIQLNNISDLRSL